VESGEWRVDEREQWMEERAVHRRAFAEHEPQTDPVYENRQQSQVQHSPKSQPSQAAKPSHQPPAITPSPHPHHKHTPTPASPIDFPRIDTGRAIAGCFVHKYIFSIKGKDERTNRCLHINLGFVVVSLVRGLFDRLFHRSLVR
jgi:hypothetical protein